MSHPLEHSRREIGRNLRELRTDAGLTGAQLASLLGWSQPKISRLETGRQKPTGEDVRIWAQACGRHEAVEPISERLRALESMYVEWRTQEHSGMQGPQAEVQARDTESSLRRVYECTIIPGILQTEPYARAVLSRYAAFRGVTSGIEDAITKRIQRQKALYDKRKRFQFLISEAALLLRYLSPEEMVNQLDRLISASSLSNVTLGIVPIGQRVSFDPGHGFWIHDDHLVTVEILSAELRLTRRDEVEQYIRAFDLCARSAQHGREARSLLLRAIDTLMN
ncbi:helix-turn-helix domain-containing protein [Nocardiopsis flavescens]|uniref:helix-turn-helix domain-containing protein n=1 Tax=Nocardiopsis flavescens TaxID=758803 RepID=UPI0036564AE4